MPTPPYQPEEMVWAIWNTFGGGRWRRVRYVRTTEDGKHVVEGGGHQLCMGDNEVSRTPPSTHIYNDGVYAISPEWWK